VLAMDDRVVIETQRRDQPVVRLLGVDQNRTLRDLPDDVLAGSIAVKDQGILATVKLWIHVANGMKTVAPHSGARGLANFIGALKANYARFQEGLCVKNRS
jgi:hypothetical protein